MVGSTKLHASPDAWSVLEPILKPKNAGIDSIRSETSSFLTERQGDREPSMEHRDGNQGGSIRYFSSQTPIRSPLLDLGHHYINSEGYSKELSQFTYETEHKSIGKNLLLSLHKNGSFPSSTREGFLRFSNVHFSKKYQRSSD